MSAPHFFVEGGVLAGGETTELSAADSHHALRSLRLREGDRVTVADGRGAFATGRLTSTRDGPAGVAIARVETVRRPEPLLEVAMAPPKGERLAWAIQKLTEVGVDRLDLLTGLDRAVRVLSANRTGRLLERLRLVARQAAMQSRRPFVMEVGTADLAGILGPDTVVLHEGAKDGLTAVLPDGPAAVRLIVGPEGSFSDGELAEARRAGSRLAGLGPAILRTETAALAGAVIALGRYSRLG